MLKNVDRSSLLNFAQLSGPVGTVAVVGNAPRLIEREDGEAIDAHDVVIRINDGRAVGFERHAGKRTTLRFVGMPIKRRHAGFFRHLREASIIVTRSENRSTLERLNWTGGTAYIDRYNALARTAFNRLAEFVDVGEIPEKNPRTGLVLLSMLVDVFRSRGAVSLYGFEMEIKTEGGEHFYDDGRLIAKNLAVHDQYHCPLSYEFGVLKQLASKALLSIN